MPARDVGLGSASMTGVEQVVDPAGLAPGQVDDAVSGLLDALDAIDRDGWYPRLEVVRPWSQHNPRISGEFACPTAIRGYLQREVTTLLTRGAVVTARRTPHPLQAFGPPFPARPPTGILLA